MDLYIYIWIVMRQELGGHMKLVCKEGSDSGNSRRRTIVAVKENNCLKNVYLCVV